MSAAIKAKSAKARAGIAISMIKRNSTFSRAFDDCFEMGDGDQVMDFIIQKAATDVHLAWRILGKMHQLGTPPYNKRLHQAIGQCLIKETESGFRLAISQHGGLSSPFETREEIETFLTFSNWKREV